MERAANLAGLGARTGTKEKAYNERISWKERKKVLRKTGGKNQKRPVGKLTKRIKVPLIAQTEGGHPRELEMYRGGQGVFLV